MSVKNCDILSISPWISRFSHLVPDGGNVLDLAAGRGRHSVWFFDRGHPVTALDRKVDELESLSAERPATAGQSFEVISADLEDGSPWPLPGRRFDAVVVVNYLHRPLFPALLAALAPGGVLLYDTFALGQEAVGRPKRPEFLLQPGELLERIAGSLEVVAFEQGLVREGDAAAVRQRIAARTGSSTAPLTPS